MTNIHPNDFVNELMETASPRKKRTLELIHKVCKEQHHRGSKDFSIPTMVKLLKDEGGPSEQTIRNKDGAEYRALLKCWADFSDGTSKKPTKMKESSFSDTILDGIEDITIRALVGIVLAENKKLKGENSILKQQTNLTIDMRPYSKTTSNNKDVDTSLSLSKLLPSEVSALQHAISAEFLKQQGYTTDEQGRVLYKGISIYKAGYVTAIKKVISICTDET